MEIRFARECEKDNIMEIWDYCFNDGPKFTDYYFNNKYKNYNTIVVEEEAEIVSSLQLNQYRIQLNNQIYNTSYVVGVSTLPEARGRGYMKYMMEFMLNELYKKNQLISILMPIDYRLYRKYGYEHCYDQIEYEIDIEDLSGFKSTGSLKRAKLNHIKDMLEIENAYLDNLNGRVIRDEDYYENLFKDVESEEGNIYIYVKTGQFLYAGYFSAIYNGTFGIASYVVGYVSSKMDTTILSAVFMCVNAISIVLSVVIEITWVQMLLFGVIGFTYPFFSVFLLERMLPKTRILGVSNRAILLRDNVSVLGKMTVMIPALFGPLLLSFVAMSVALTGGGIYLPFSEETSRKTLVNYLEDNE